MKWISGKNGKQALALFTALCVLLCCSAALAQAEAKVEQTAVQAGDTVTVTLTVTGKNLAVASGVYAYDPALLSYTEGDGGAGDGFFAMHSAEKNGSSTLSARFTFTAVAEGEAKVEFTLESLLDYSGKEQDKGSPATVTVAIAAAPAEPTPTPVNYSDPAVGVQAENVQGAVGQMYVWRSIENVTIPSRYSEADVTYHGETVKGAVVKDSDAPTLLYLSGPAGENAGYYIFDQGKDSLYAYRTVSSVSKSYILLEPDGSVPVPEGFTETTLTIEEEEVKAWVNSDAQGEVYLLYGRNPSGEVGFYYYNPGDESLQRYAVLPARPVVVEPTPAPAATPAPELTPEQAPAAQPQEGELILSKGLFFGICGAAGLFLILFVTVLVFRSVEEKRRRQRAAERRKKERAAMEAARGANIEE